MRTYKSMDLFMDSKKKVAILFCIGAALLCLAIIFCSCSKDDDYAISKGVDDSAIAGTWSLQYDMASGTQQSGIFEDNELSTITFQDNGTYQCNGYKGVYSCKKGTLEMLIRYKKQDTQSYVTEAFKCVCRGTYAVSEGRLTYTYTYLLDEQYVGKSDGEGKEFQAVFKLQ